MLSISSLSVKIADFLLAYISSNSVGNLKMDVLNFPSEKSVYSMLFTKQVVPSLTKPT